MEKHIDDIKMLALGHSHIADGIDMAILGDSGFNAAIPGMKMDYIAEIAKRYVPRMSNLKILIIPLGYNFQYSTGINKQQDHMMIKYWDIGLSGKSILDNLDILYETKPKLRKLIVPKKELSFTYDSLGHQHIPPSDAVYIHDHLPPQSLKSGIPENYIRRVKEIAQVCKENGVRLIVVTTPCLPTYIDRTTERGVNELNQLVDSMRSVNSGVEYYNMMADKRFEKKDFFDSSHLNEIGAVKLSEIIKNEIIGKKSNPSGVDESGI